MVKLGCIICTMCLLAVEIQAVNSIDSSQVIARIDSARKLAIRYQYDAATRLLEETLDTLRSDNQDGDHYLSTYAQMLLVLYQIAHGKMDAVASFIDSSRYLLRPDGNDFLKSEFLALRCNYQIKKGNISQAEVLVDSALQIWAKSNQEKDEQWIRLAYLKTTVDYYQLDFDASYQALREILTEYNAKHRNPQDYFVAQVYNGMALRLNGLGDYRRALELLELRKDLITQLNGPEDQGIATTLYNMGLNQSKLRQFRKSISTFKEAMQLRRKAFPADHPYMADYLSNIGKNFGDLGHYDSAVIYFERASPIYLKHYGHSHFRTAQHHSFMAKVLLANGQLNQARKYYRTSLTGRIAAIGFNDNNVAFVYMQLSKINQRQGKISLARSCIDSAQLSLQYVPNMELTKAIGHPMLCEVLNQKAALLRSISISDPAAILQIDSTYQEAMRVIDYLRAELRDDLSRSALTDIKDHIYEDAMEFYYEQWQKNQDKRWLQQALLVAERRKNNNLRAHLAHHEFLEADLLEETDLHREIGLRKRIVELENNLRNASQPTEIKNLQNSLTLAKDSMAAFIDFLQYEYPVYHRMKYLPVTLEVVQLRQMLSEETLLLNYFLGTRGMYRIGLSRHRHFFEKDTSQEELQQIIEFLRDTILHTKHHHTVDPLPSLTQLAEMVLPSSFLQANPDIKKISIVPDGAISFVPFDCLPLEGTPLVQHYTTSFLNAAQDLTTFSETHRAKRSIFFRPEYGQADTIILRRLKKENSLALRVRGELLPLPGAEEEVNTTSDMIDGSVYEGTNATKQTFLQVAPEADVLHLSMHSVADHLTPMASSLLFDNQHSVRDGWLFSHEIYQLPLRAKMVVLSACNTGFGPLHSGEGTSSLSRAFQYAGAGSVVHGQWQMPDASSGKIIPAFYQQLLNGFGKDEALRNAKLEYLQSAIDERLRHPIYWAGFALVGDPAPLEFVRDSKWKQVLVISLLILMIWFVSINYPKMG